MVTPLVMSLRTFCLHLQPKPMDKSHVRLISDTIVRVEGNGAPNKNTILILPKLCFELKKKKKK